MYEVFNMGVGFCVVARPADSDAALAAFRRHGFESWVLGRAVADERKRVWLRPVGLVGEGDRFTPINPQ
jgi:phosphoribosylaminoimidazole (AIR) synthetase